MDNPQDIKHGQSCRAKISTITYITYLHINQFAYPALSVTHSTHLFLPILPFLGRFMLPSEPILPPKPKPTTRKVSYLRENAPPLPSTYAATLQNHHLYQHELGTLEAHRARHNARTNLFHGDNKDLAQEAWKDLRLHGQSLTFRKVTPFPEIN